jgi:hypothetical protein
MSLQKLRFKSALALELICYIQLCPREPKQQTKIHRSQNVSHDISLYVPPASSLASGETLVEDALVSGHLDRTCPKFDS